jgi:hypothetical protein
MGCENCNDYFRFPLLYLTFPFCTIGYFLRIKLSHIRGSVTNNGFWIGWLNLLILLYNYNQLWQLTINGCLRLTLFLTGLLVSSLSTMSNHERRIIGLYCEWINWIHQWTLFYSLWRTDERALTPTGCVLHCNIHCHRNMLIEPLLIDGLFQLVPETWVRAPFVNNVLFLFQESCHNTGRRNVKFVVFWVHSLIYFVYVWTTLESGTEMPTSKRPVWR